MFFLVNDQVFSFRNDQVFFSITGTVVSSRNHQGFSFANDQERVKGFFKIRNDPLFVLRDDKRFLFF